MKKIGFYTLISLFIDQVLKILIESFLSWGEEFVIFSNFFTITYVKNYGAAFSLLNGNRFLFIGIALFALGMIYLLFLKDKKLKQVEVVAYSLLISGIIGNLIDRAFRGYVVDYFAFTLFHYSCPIFNFADICIVLSTIWIIWFTAKEEYCERNHRQAKRKSH